MNHYGNILTIFNKTQQQLDYVEAWMIEKNCPFELIENTFYFGTSSLKKSRDLHKNLSDLGFRLTLYMVVNPEGDYIKGNGIDSSQMNRMDDIFFGDI